MGQARVTRVWAMALAAVLVSVGTAGADTLADGEIPESREHYIEEMMYDLFGRGGELGDVRCATVSFASQSSTMTVTPHASPQTVGLEAGGGPVAPADRTVAAIVFPFECVSSVVGLLDSEPMNVVRLLP